MKTKCPNKCVAYTDRPTQISHISSLWAEWMEDRVDELEAIETAAHELIASAPRSVYGQPYPDCNTSLQPLASALNVCKEYTFGKLDAGDRFFVDDEEFMKLAEIDIHHYPHNYKAVSLKTAKMKEFAYKELVRIKDQNEC